MAKEQHTEEQISSVAQWLRGLPEVERKKALTTRMEVVRRLRPEIQDALKRGYSHEQIAEGLSTKGVKISGSTLKNYLQRAKSTTTAKKSTRRKAADETQNANTSEDASSRKPPEQPSAHDAKPESAKSAATTEKATKLEGTGHTNENNERQKKKYDTNAAEFEVRPDRLKL